jgi:RNA polymerase sigma factor (sigma-70 family)
MFNVSMRITNNYVDAEDILQEAFLNAFQRIHTFKGDSTFGAWLKRIVVNQSISHIQKRRLALIPMDENLDCADQDDRASEEELNYQVESIRKSIQQLPDGYRVVLSLYLLEGYDHQEIAEVLNITESTSKSQYSRARKKLLEMLRKEN